MIIYGEFLFAENFIIGFLLILLTGRLTGRLSLADESPNDDVSSGKASFTTAIKQGLRPGGLLRLLLASAVGGVGGFIIFLPLTGLGSVVFRLLTGVACVFTAFGCKGIIRNTCLFYILTFLSGGMVMALLLWIQQPMISHQGIIYIEAITYLKLLCFGILAFGLTYWFVKFIRNQKVHVTGIVTIIIGNRRFEFEAYVDSGNSLTEPISGRPVVLADEKAVKTMGLEKIMSVALSDVSGAEQLSFSANRYALIPYHAVGVDRGYLEAVRADRIIFRNKEVQNSYIAFYEGEFQGYNVLLNKEFLEGRA